MYAALSSIGYKKFLFLYTNIIHTYSKFCISSAYFFAQTYLEAAKTKFTKGYKGLNPSKITTTVGLNIGQIDTKSIRLSFWDLGGQEELQSLWDKVCFSQQKIR